MKIFSSLLFALFFTLNIAFANAGKETVSLVCKIENCSFDTLNLYQWDGIVFKRVQKSAFDKNQQAYIFNVAKNKTPQYYYFGGDVNNLRMVLLGDESKVTYSGSCYTFSELKVSGSNTNDGFDKMSNRLNGFLKEGEGYINAYRQAADDNGRKTLEKMIIDTDTKKVAFLDSLKKVNPFFAQYVSLNTFPSYFSVKDKGKYNNDEVQYFAKEFFQFVNFKDAGYNDQPAVFESFRNYTVNLTNLVQDSDQHKAYIETHLAKIPADTKAYKSALGGVVVAMMGAQHINYFYFGQKYIDTYKKEEPELTAQLQAHIDQLKPMQTHIVGTFAPDFTLNTPDGKPMSLSSLRGKIILIDFWASWCGPCRRENPNVVRVYNKYKSKGFDILGVSLDSSKERWEQAIQQDGLTWNHVSDLQNWQSGAAKLYAVTSIPQTVLVDTKGKILARNLRGEELENKLRSLLGE